ncbi:MAG: hypothetical protein CSA82_02200, partial [Actinobacteria bacterium]
MVNSTHDPKRTPPSSPQQWLVDRMYAEYRTDPESVDQSWRDYFASREVPPAPTN